MAMTGLIFVCFFSYASAFALVLGLFPVQWEQRASLGSLGLIDQKLKKKASIFSVLRKFASINRPLCAGALRRRVARDLAMARVDWSPEELFLVKELVGAVILLVTYVNFSSQVVLWMMIGIGGGYYLPEFWLKSKIKKIKAVMIKELPDAIDLLGLCVNAGLDFMLALKWVVDKSQPSVMVDELNTVLQEINVGKTRRDAIKDLAVRYELPDLSTFARTLIQADKMGTSVTEALNILSEDMRLSRFRRGEQMALKAPLKMLVPLLVFIFPVVGTIVAGPILLDFMQNNPFQATGN